MANVQRFAKDLTSEHLEDVLGGGRWPTEQLPSVVQLEPVETAVASVGSQITGSAIDRALVEPLHQALSGLSRREAADPKVWQWLCVIKFPDLVWRRWVGQAPLPEMLREALIPARYERFLCRPTLRGISRNTMSRLWWTAEQLGGDYELARQALSNQDMFQNTFERFFGMYPPAARACLDRFKGRSEGEIRAAAKWLQQCASTTTLEALDQDAVAAILDEALAA
jgi:hypothetical protein